MDLAELRNEVFRLRPIFGAFYHEWGERTWPEYYRFVRDDVQEKGITPRASILSAIEGEVTRLFGDASLGSRTARAVSEKGWVSTADHHGLLCHPYFYGSNLAQSEESVCGSENIHVTLSFGNVSLGNDSFPRGFFFHDTDGTPVRIHFKNAQERTLPVFGARGVAKEEVIRARERLLHIKIPPRAHTRLFDFFDRIVADERIWDRVWYGEQLTLMNGHLWRALFGEKRGDLVYLEIDTVVSRLLCEKYLATETVISKLLTHQTWHDAYTRHFDGIPGAHHGDRGTHFFWFVDREQGLRKALRLENGKLLTDDGVVTISATPDSLTEALCSRTIIPGTALILLVVQGEESLSCGGGVSQPEYLAAMMNAWNRVRKERGEVAVSNGDTSIISGDYTFFQNSMEGGTNRLPTLFDVYLYEHNHHQSVSDALSCIKTRDTIDAMLPILYSFVRHVTVPENTVVAKLRTIQLL
jgi:hypothetical protein